MLSALSLALAAQDPVTEPDGSRTLIAEAFVPAPPERLWDAVTTAEGWKTWAVPAAWIAPSDPDLMETAYDPAARPGAATNIQQRFVARLPRRMLVFRTVKTPAGFPHAEAFMRVTHFLELEAQPGGTRVRLSSTGYPAGAEGDALLGFFGKGNRATLDKLVIRFALEPLAFLAGHCWQGTLPTGEANKHCFTKGPDGITDRHEVIRAGKGVYGGETLYAWDAATASIRFTYSSGGKKIGEGSVRPIDAGLDFGSTEYGTGDKKVRVATRWLRIGGNAYDAVDSAPAAPRFDHTVRYTRID
ncbi:MAG: SRPBCC domain-containing protein [Sphingomonadales bacterium]|nr:MAG: SRPBCC domain-containing protein [Sphingomonadales bacterium]